MGAGPSLLLLCRPGVMLPPFSTLAATFFQLSDNNVHQALLAAVHEVTFENVAASPGRSRVTCHRTAVTNELLGGNLVCADKTQTKTMNTNDELEFDKPR